MIRGLQLNEDRLRQPLSKVLGIPGAPGIACTCRVVTLNNGW